MHDSKMIKLNSVLLLCCVFLSGCGGSSPTANTPGTSDGYVSVSGATDASEDTTAPGNSENGGSSEGTAIPGNSENGGSSEGTAIPGNSENGGSSEGTAVPGNSENGSSSEGTAVPGNSENTGSSESTAVPGNSETPPEIPVTECSRQLYAQTTVNVRSGNSTSYAKIGTLYENQEVTATGICKNGWYRIEFSGQTGYVSGNYLKDEKVFSFTEFMDALDAGDLVVYEDLNTAQLKNYFCAYKISEPIVDRINGKSYQKNKYVALSDLRYMKVLHYNFDHKIQVGELIVAKDLVSDYQNIFYELFLGEYEIESLYLIDNYWTGNASDTDTASIDHNNSSCFCYRAMTDSSSLSKHAYGRAIDINPLQNPYVTFKDGVATSLRGDAYVDRTDLKPHMITYDDLCFQIFTKYGFSWGGDFKNIKDYQHFEKS